MSSVQSVSRSEAELAMKTSRGVPHRQLEPLTLFHLRDALMVCGKQNFLHLATRKFFLNYSNISIYMYQQEYQ